MKKWSMILIVAIVLVSLFTVNVLAAGPQQNVDRNGPPADRGNGRGRNRASTSLTDSEIEALGMALDDEYKALATYQAVIEDLGPVAPFVNIAKAEQKHIDALVRLYDKYGLTVPTSDWADLVPHFDSVAEAAQAGVDAEIENAALYDTLFSMVESPDVIRVFENLRRASLEKHLPAFERYAN